MIFYRSAHDTGPKPMRVSLVRWASVAALVTYPVGAVLGLIGDAQDNKAVWLAGMALTLCTIICFIAIVGTGVSRIAAEERKHLDPLELELRQKAYSRAYHVLGVVALIAVFYMQVAADMEAKFTLWRPTTSEHWQGVMWGALLYVFMLPTTLLAWSLPLEEIDD